jgi:uncharacterized protein (TIGR02996 family)
VSRERCPECKSDNITGRGFDTGDGDELQERYCFACGFGEERMRSEGGVSWHVPAPPQPPHRMHAATGIEHTLLSEIYDAPDDDGPRSIYADWLIEQGDPLGTFISLQLGRRRNRDPVVSPDEQMLLDEHWSAWMGMPSTAIDKRHVEFERGFWSACDRVSPSERVVAQVPEVITARSWGTVRRLALASATGNEAQVLVAVRHSLRVLAIESRTGMIRVAGFDPILPIEELVLAFDVSREPPALEFPSLPRLRRLGVHCLGEFGARWIERVDAAGIHDLLLVTRPHPEDLDAMLSSAKRTRITRLAVAIGQLTLHAERDSDGSLAIRSIALAPFDDLLDTARIWIDRLGKHVDGGVKVTTDRFTAERAHAADMRGLKLVRSATTFAARPR